MHLPDSGFRGSDLCNSARLVIRPLEPFTESSDDEIGAARRCLGGRGLAAEVLPVGHFPPPPPPPPVFAPL